MAKGWVHTVYDGGGWANTVEDENAVSWHLTRYEAVKEGRAEAERRRTDHLIHDRDGGVVEHNSYAG